MYSIKTVVERIQKYDGVGLVGLEKSILWWVSQGEASREQQDSYLDAVCVIRLKRRIKQAWRGVADREDHATLMKLAEQHDVLCESYWAAFQHLRARIAC